MRNFDLTYNRTVPARGSLNLGFGYATGFTTAGVTTLAHQLQDGFKPVACSLKPKGSRVSAAALSGASKKSKKGVLRLTARCNQAAALTLTGGVKVPSAAREGPSRHIHGTRDAVR